MEGSSRGQMCIEDNTSCVDNVKVSSSEAEDDPAAIEEAMIEDKKLVRGGGRVLCVRQKKTNAAGDEEIAAKL